MAGEGVALAPPVPLRVGWKRTTTGNGGNVAEATERTRVVVAHIAGTVRQILREGLESRGYDVVTTALGEEAMGLVGEGDVDLLVVSLELEDVDGWGVAAAVARRAPGTAVVALTADARRATRERAEATGFDAFFTLPIRPFELVDRLEAMGMAAGGGAGD